MREGDNLRLRCQATGEPLPQVEWTRADGGVIPMGQWRGECANEMLREDRRELMTETVLLCLLTFTVILFSCNFLYFFD